MTPAAIVRQIETIISLLVASGMCDHQKYPALKKVGSQTLVTIPGSPDLSASMKDRSYVEIYESLRESESYHIRMLDGALIQFLFTIENKIILNHRLSFFPCPNLEMYEIIPEYYDSDELFADVVGFFSVKAPVRFDFSLSDAEHVDVDHPKCHLTLGQYKGCRIPVTGPLTPLRFMRFTLRNFYNPAYERMNLDKLALKTKLNETITDKEREILFISC